MRKHSVRKWLHALLDLLPLVVIPVFMVYSHRHQIDSYSVRRTEYNTIHMQQYVINGLPNSNNNITNGFNAHITYGNNMFAITDITDNELYMDVELFLNTTPLSPNDYLLFKCNVVSKNGISEFNVYGEDYDGINSLVIVESFDISSKELIIQYQGDFSTHLDYLHFNFAWANEDTVNIAINKIQLFNLTQMFGSGNEPTIDEFNALFPNDYYDVDSNAVAYVPYTRTYNDTDIGSQIFYSLYNSVDKYFNCNKLFSFNGVYNWINFNLFGGNAPLMVDVVYQIIVYEFFMDLIFLIYSVFMFIIDFASNFLEYSFSWSRRGGR